MSKTTVTAEDQSLRQGLNGRRQNDLLNPDKNVAGSPLLSAVQQQYREGLRIKEEKKKRVPTGNPRGRKPGVEVRFAQAFKAFKGTKEYEELYQAVCERKFLTEHLVWMAFKAGFKANK